MAKKKTGTTQKAYEMENRSVKNRTRKLQKHLKNFPNDKQSADALKRGLKYGRKKPLNSIWKSSTKEYAHVLRKFFKESGMNALPRRRSSEVNG